LTARPVTSSFFARIWSCRWPVLRLGLACFIIWVFAADSAARLARLQLAALPGFDYAAEVRSLTNQGRFAEAETIAAAGIDDPDADHPTITEARTDNRSQRSRSLRMLKDAGLGAVTGRADSLEGLVGAVAADLFIVGDIRDLVVEGGRLALDGETDELILALSVAGVVTTLAPEIDWVPSLFKVARKSGALTARFTESLLKVLKAADPWQATPIFAAGANIARKASPGAFIRLLKHIDDPAELAHLSKFVDTTPQAAAALHITGDAAADILKPAWKAGPDATAHAERLVVKAARKGAAGRAFLGSTGSRALLKPHPLLGLAKALSKGNAEKLLIQLASRTDAGVWWILPAASGWALLEILLIGSRLVPRRKVDARQVPLKHAKAA